MSKNILHTALAVCLALPLSSCGFVLAPVAGTAGTVAQWSVKGADKSIEQGKEAAAASAQFSRKAATASVELGRQMASASAELGRQAVGGVAAAARSVADTAVDVTGAAISLLRPSSAEEAEALEEGDSPR